MNLEEKKKEIEGLWQNLDPDITVYKSFTDKSDIVIQWELNYSQYPIKFDNHYNSLVEILKENQKEPEIYTIDEIEEYDY